MLLKVDECHSQTLLMVNHSRWWRKSRVVRSLCVSVNTCWSDVGNNSNNSNNNNILIYKALYGCISVSISTNVSTISIGVSVCIKM